MSKTTFDELAGTSGSESGLVSRPLLAWGLLVGTVAWTCGCDSAPRAPLLRDSPVYHSESEGFRFRVPEGWSQSANSVLPAGDLPGDIFLTRYQVKTTEGGASMQIICSNDIAVEQLEKHWSGPAFGVAAWKVEESLQKVNAGPVAGERIVYSGLQGGKTLMKHVTCLHKNKRLYSFVGLYWQNDVFARQQIERALESLIW
ncbi:MAG: hypothetical protein IAG10_08405 [Planctomycetaceae bacterium]|nr:hypothetical protein [Planctomycetaceae bacterium]